MCELEEENNALEQEHLVMLKKQEQMVAANGGTLDEKEQSTMAESKGHIATEESAQVVANKDK